MGLFNKIFGKKRAKTLISSEEHSREDICYVSSCEAKARELVRDALEDLVTEAENKGYELACSYDYRSISDKTDSYKRPDSSYIYILRISINPIGKWGAEDTRLSEVELLSAIREKEECRVIFSENTEKNIRDNVKSFL